MNITMRTLIFLLTLIGSATAAAGELTVVDAWVREAPPGATVLAGFLVIQNHSPQDRELVAAESTDFGRVELHRTVVEGGVARMLPQQSMPVPAGGQLDLEPGGYHLMLMQPKRPLAEGDSVNLTLRFDDGSTQAVSMRVRKAPAMGGHPMNEQGSAHGTTAE